MVSGKYDWSTKVSGGTQPVSVLQYNILHFFETVTPRFAEEVQELIREAGLKPGLTFHCASEPILIQNARGEWITLAASVDKNNQVEFHETFLSYIWCISYSLVVLYDEANAKPARGLKGSDDVIERAQNLLRYGLSLIREFKPWDTDNLPNPRSYGKADQEYIEKANAVFCFAVVFVLLHEVGHVQKEHTQTLETYVSTFDSVGQEIEADKWAIEKIMEGLGDERDFAKNCGVISGLCSLLLLSRSLLGGDHPDTDDRLRDGVLALRLPDNDTAWMVALLGVRIWEQTYHRPLIWPKDVSSPKSYFLKTMENLKAHK